MKNQKQPSAKQLGAAIKLAEEELKIGAKILEWEIGDLWGHVGVRLPEDKGIAVQMFRRPEEGKKDWLVHFDYSLNKLSGVGTPPRESTIYTEIFKARPDVNAAVHSHAPMCVALSLADKTVSCVHMQSGRFGRGVPIYPAPIYILDDAEGADLARTLDQANAVLIKGHGIVTVGKTIDEACMTALYMERTAKIMAMAQLFGFSGVTDKFIETLSGSKEKLLSRARTKMAHSADWSYYADKIKKGELWTRGWT
ncbi:MAG TPA: class II aldolase/adducin family protein [Candidatus Binatia bacterium]|nr:class II aldolase/adducin family protein [Candidatus Binatia bacterium]